MRLYWRPDARHFGQSNWVGRDRIRALESVRSTGYTGAWALQEYTTYHRQFLCGGRRLNTYKFKYILGFVAVVEVMGMITACSCPLGIGKSCCDANKQRQNVNPAQIDWVQVDGGTFEMGRPGPDSLCDALPAQTVEVRCFEVSHSEVTVRQYKACVDAGFCPNPEVGYPCNWIAEGRLDHPMNCVTWYEARKFADWVGGRLLTEAEWEYLARQSQPDSQMQGKTDDETELNTKATNPQCDDGSFLGTRPVCQWPGDRTCEGVCDLLGGVNEWTSDSFRPSPDYGPVEVKSTEPGKVVRGDICASDDPYWLFTCRRGFAPAAESIAVGFRVAR